MNNNHTPTPWTVKHGNFYEIHGNNIDPIAYIPEWSQGAYDAEFIVRAVNSHEALLDQLKGTAIALHYNVQHEGSGEHFQNCTHPMCVENKKSIAQASERGS